MTQHEDLILRLERAEAAVRDAFKLLDDSPTISGSIVIPASSALRWMVAHASALTRALQSKEAG